MSCAITYRGVRLLTSYRWLSAVSTTTSAKVNGRRPHSDLIPRLSYSITSSNQTRTMATQSSSEPQSVANFREYLRINTMQPNPDYELAYSFLTRMAGELGLPCRRITVNQDPLRDTFLITWEGSQPELSSVLLNSHIDVVPVFPEHWKYEPFSAHKDENGDIFARGTQDMKCVGMQYIEAVRKLKAAGKQFSRTMHLCFVPDEEIGGHLGMELLVHMKEFKELNVGFVLDEGLANPSSAFTVFYGERSPWWIKVHCSGDPGHGSRFIENNAGEKLRRVVNRFLEFRDQEEKRLQSDPGLRLGDVTTVNLTKLEGGVQMNVVPAELTAGFDIRITPTVDLKQFEEQLTKWCKEAGEGVTYEFLQKYEGKNLTNATDANPWWHAFSQATNELGLTLEKEIFPAATDSRYLRAAGYPAIGFSPMNHTPILLHDHNEFLNEKIFTRGIEIYETVLPAVASVPKFDPATMPSP